MRMTDDLEYLKEIKDTEDKIENEIKTLTEEQEKKLSDLQQKLDNELQSRTEEYKKRYDDAMKRASDDASKQAELILNTAKEKSGSMHLDLPKSETGKIIIKQILEYLEG